MPSGGRGAPRLAHTPRAAGACAGVGSTVGADFLQKHEEAALQFVLEFFAQDIVRRLQRCVDRLAVGAPRVTPTQAIEHGHQTPPTYVRERRPGRASLAYIIWQLALGDGLLLLSTTLGVAALVWTARHHSPAACRRSEPRGGWRGACGTGGVRGPYHAAIVVFLALCGTRPCGQWWRYAPGGGGPGRRHRYTSSADAARAPYLAAQHGQAPTRDVGRAGSADARLDALCVRPLNRAPGGGRGQRPARLAVCGPGAFAVACHSRTSVSYLS